MDPIQYPLLHGSADGRAVARVVNGAMAGRLNVVGFATVSGTTATVTDARCHERCVVLPAPATGEAGFTVTAYRKGEFDIALSGAGPHTLRYVILG